MARHGRRAPGSCRRARVCVATDVAARGLDLPDLGLVIHALGVGPAPDTEHLGTLHATVVPEYAPYLERVGVSSLLVVPLAAVSSAADGSTRVQVKLADGGLRVTQVDVGVSADGFVEVRPTGDAELRPGDAVVAGTRNPPGSVRGVDTGTTTLVVPASGVTRRRRTRSSSGHRP